MHLAGKATIVKIAAAMMLFFAACKESAPPKTAAKEKAEDANPSPSPDSFSPSPSPSSSTDTDTCASSSDSTDTETDSGTDTESSTGSDSEDPFALTGKAVTVKHKKHKKQKTKPAAKTVKGFSLTDTVSYDSDIKSIIDGNCATSGCHVSGGESPDLSNYSSVKAGLASSVTQIDADKMPKSAPLSSTDKQKIHDWQNAGAPETSSDTSTDSGSDTDTDTDSSSDSSSSSDCGSSDESNEVTDGYEDLVNPPELAECHDKGKVFDRKAGECHKAEIAEFSCDHSGILGAFKKVGVNAESKLSSIEGDGYKIDQCGIYDKEPIVYFTKQGDSGGDSISLKIKKLCKPSASVCQ